MDSSGKPAPTPADESSEVCLEPQHAVYLRERTVDPRRLAYQVADDMGIGARMDGLGEGPGLDPGLQLRQ